MAKLGKENFSVLKAQTRSSIDPMQNIAVKRVTKNILANVNFKYAEWEIVVFESSVPNAFALPGGKIGINSGLFKYIHNDAELAMVIAHEIAHIICCHVSERYGREILKNGLGKALELTAKDEDLNEGFKLISNVGMTLPYSRDQEYEADFIGMKLLSQAGYSPDAAITFFVNLKKISKSQSFEFLSTHPLTIKRINALKRSLDEFQLLYHRSPTKRNKGWQYPNQNNENLKNLLL